MSTQKPTVTIEDKAKIMEIHKLFKASPKSITQEARNFVQTINDKCWEIKKDEAIVLETRLFVFEIMRLNHEILGRDFQESWKPRAASGGGKTGRGQTWTATKEQRAQNCKDLILFLQEQKIWDNLVDTDKAEIISNTWGTIKQ